MKTLHAAFGLMIVLATCIMARFIMLHESLPSNQPGGDRIDSSLHKILRAQRRLEDRLEKVSRSLESMQLHQRQQEDM